MEGFLWNLEITIEDGFVLITNSDLLDPCKWQDTSGDYMVHEATRKVKHKQLLDFLQYETGDFYPQSYFSDPSKWTDSSWN